MGKSPTCDGRRRFIAASRCCWPYIKTEDELAVRQNFNGRTVEQNIGETTRHGAELALDAAWGGGFSARVAYTYIRAIVAQAYATCVGTPCKPAIVESGSYLHGRRCRLLGGESASRPRAGNAALAVQRIRPP